MKPKWHKWFDATGAKSGQPRRVPLTGHADDGGDGDGRMDMFRRAKLMLDAVPGEVLAKAATSGLLVGRLGLTDAKGQPLCASVRPPAIDWSAG